MWWTIAIAVLVLGVIAYAEWRERRGPGRARRSGLETVASNDHGAPRPLDGAWGASDV